MLSSAQMLQASARPAAGRRAQAHARCAAAQPGPASAGMSQIQSFGVQRGMLNRSTRQRGCIRSAAANARIVCLASGAHGAERVVVAGATSRSGQVMIELLRKAGHEVMCASHGCPIAADWMLHPSFRDPGAVPGPIPVSSFCHRS